MYLSAQATMLPERHLPLMDSIGMSWETDPSKCSSLLKASLIAMCSGSLLALANTARGSLASWNQTTVTDRSPEPETSTSPPSNSSRLRSQSKLTILANQFSNLGLPFFLLETSLTENQDQCSTSTLINRYLTWFGRCGVGRILLVAGQLDMPHGVSQD